MTELNQQPRIIQFNKLTREFITLMSPVEDVSLLNQVNYEYSDEVMIDEDNEVVVGNADSWEITAIADLPFEVKESDLNLLARERILKSYPMESQLNILGDVLEKVAAANAIECEDLKSMNDFIDEVRRVNTLRKEYYSTSDEFNYVSDADFESKLALKYKGAIDEYERTILGF